MALTFDFTGIADYENVDPVLKEAGVWATVFVGINSLTADRVDEFYKRISFSEKVQGAGRTDENGGDVYFTREDVESLVGLRTNASTLTKAAFIKRVYEYHERYTR